MSSAGPNKYSHTPRRVFERSQDRLNLKIAKLKTEIRALERAVRALEQMVLENTAALAFRASLNDHGPA